MKLQRHQITECKEQIIEGDQLKMATNWISKTITFSYLLYTSYDTYDNSPLGYLYLSTAPTKPFLNPLIRKHDSVGSEIPDIIFGKHQKALLPTGFIPRPRMIADPAICKQWMLSRSKKDRTLFTEFVRLYHCNLIFVHVLYNSQWKVRNTRNEMYV